MAEDIRENPAMLFRPTESLRKRLDAAKQAVALASDMLERSVTYQFQIPWLLNRAMDALGVPRANGEDVGEQPSTDDDALNGRR